MATHPLSRRNTPPPPVRCMRDRAHDVKAPRVDDALDLDDLIGGAAHGGLEAHFAGGRDIGPGSRQSLKRLAP